jgi:hypothetical protein
VEYLGHIISAKGVSTNPSKIQAIQNWPVLKNITELRGFLGLAGYYRRFIIDYGKICRPLFDSLKKGSFLGPMSNYQLLQQSKKLFAQHQYWLCLIS